MAKEKGKHDWLLCLLLAIIVVLILVIGGSLYYALVIEDKENTVEDNANILTNEIIKEENFIYDGLVEENKTVTDVPKETYKPALNQDEVNKIAKVTIEDYLNLTDDIFSSPKGILVSDYFEFYKDYEEMSMRVENINGILKTDIEYEIFVDKITKYMSKELFESKYSEIYTNINGYLGVFEGGASGGKIDVTNAKFISQVDGVYTYETTYDYYTFEEVIGEKDKEKNIKIEKVYDNWIVIDEE